MQLLNKIQPLLEKELFDYMLFRIQNPENFPRNNYTPYTEDSGMEPREMLGMTGMTGNMSGKGDVPGLSDQDYRTSNTSNIHFRSMTTSPRDPNIMHAMANNPNLRNHADSISSASPYRRHNNYDNSHSQIANTTGYSNSSSNTYFNHTGENSRYGNRNLHMGTPYDKRNYDGDNSPVISNFGTPYTKNSVHTPESQQRLGNSYTNQSGYYPKVHTPYQNQKGLYEISTASSSRSTYSRNTNTIYSFEASSISNSSGIEKAKLAKNNPVSYANMLDSRIQSAQMNTDSSPGVYGKDKRTYSATEEQNKSGLQNKLSKKAVIPGSDTYLEYSITKKLDDFISSNFDGQGTLDQQFNNKMRQGEVFSSIDSFQTQDSQSYQQLKQGNPANPYRGTRPDLAQKLKKLQAQQPPMIPEADETKRTIKKETSDTTNDRNKDRKPPLPLHKRGVSQHNNKDFDKTTEKDNESSDDDDNSFSIKNNAPSRTMKKKANNTKTSEVLTIPDYKKLDYLTKDQLEPIEGNVEGTIRVMNQELKTDDWQKQFEASNNLRRLLQFHCSILVNSAMFNLHSTTQDVLRMVESLRSNLSKNGLITLTEMCCTLKRQMDSEADMIYAKLIKKGSDANSFISEEVKKALVSVSQNCSDTKIIPILLGMFQQKAIPAKINIALCCEAVITKNENRVNQLRDFEKIVIILGNYILDSANEVRNASKQAMSVLVSFLFSKSELDKILQRQFTEANYNRINAIVSKELSSGNSTLMITNLQATGKNKSAPVTKPKITTSKTSVDDEEEKVECKPLMRTREYPRESTDSKESPLLSTSDKPKKVMKAGARDPRDYDDLQGIFPQADSSDWKTRYDAANALADFGRKHCDSLPRSKMVHKYMDYFTKLMQDSNTKVSSFAISAFMDMVPELKPSIESNITTVSNASLALLGSVNPSIKNAAENLFDTISDHIDPSVLIPSWTNSLPFTNVKAKVVILSKLNEIASGLYLKKPVLITKNVIPVISKCLEETKADIRNATHQLFQTLYSFMNRDLLDYVPANKSQIVFDIVAGK